ncbi:MAG TPA: hypothetical protein VMV57_02720 [Terracidiphilus sp.]|nr:hypothetical protein [Terracidiphilus sp.]
MQTDPSRNWQALADIYSKKPDGELCELADDFANLTEVAQEVLRQEMNKRGLADPTAAKTQQRRPQSPAEAQFGPPDGESAEDGEDGEAAHEYTWKTPLCTGHSKEHAWQIKEMLRREGIECWIDVGQNAWEQSSPRVMVAADELELAREVLAKPIPQEIVDESMGEAPEFEAPPCPACGTADPVLVGVDPANLWQCEACGNEWSEGDEGVSAEAEEPES